MAMVIAGEEQRTPSSGPLMVGQYEHVRDRVIDVVLTASIIGLSVMLCFGSSEVSLMNRDEWFLLAGTSLALGASRLRQFMVAG